MKPLTLATMAALLAIYTTPATAEQTNVVEYIHIRLLGYAQGETVKKGNQEVTQIQPVRLSTARVINALGQVTGKGFSPLSRLVLVTPAGGGVSSVEVRDGNTKVDVTGFFALETIGTPVVSSVLNTRNGQSSRVTYSIQRFALQDDPGYNQSLGLHFDLSGFSIDNSSNPKPRFGNLLRVDGAGVGDDGGKSLVIQGEVGVSGSSIEVVQDEDPPYV
jgi:hypothetical protein